MLEKNAREEGNVVVVVIASLLRCLVQCIGDIVEWISSYVYVQVAVRGLGFWDGARATYALATFSNLIYVISAILVEYVVTMGAALCGLAGAAIAGLVGYATCGVSWKVVPPGIASVGVCIRGSAIHDASCSHNR